jgi:hypothetical protein
MEDLEMLGLALKVVGLLPSPSLSFLVNVYFMFVRDSRFVERT